MKFGGSPKCVCCSKSVYPTEQVRVNDLVAHKACFKCHTCDKVLSTTTAGVHEGHFYCTPHLKQASGPALVRQGSGTLVTKSASFGNASRQATAVQQSSSPLAQQCHKEAAAEPKPLVASCKSSTFPVFADMSKNVMAMQAANQRPGGLARRVFDKYDSDKDGSITREDLGKLCMEMGYMLSEEELTAAIRLLDKDASGTIEFSEFQSWWCQEARFNKLQMDETQLQFLHDAFEKYLQFDSDGNGIISRDEFDTLYSFLREGVYTSQTVDSAWEQMDEDRNGSISFNEYVDYLLFCKNTATQQQRQQQEEHMREELRKKQVNSGPCAQ
eukprot:TRINITY_DN3893_c0_g1_i2.p1 TRINITY_DN3893_c0_g1~~TRINITY_DN3893_c0_g1_i2.p1  ORF type:complete len:328 (-),score=116.82 TRINITY_DN3893_c0_g1_i2:100-1083(-)